MVGPGQIETSTAATWMKTAGLVTHLRRTAWQLLDISESGSDQVILEVKVIRVEPESVLPSVGSWG